MFNNTQEPGLSVKYGIVREMRTHFSKNKHAVIALTVENVRIFTANALEF